MSEFLESLPFLGPQDREKLAANGLDEPEAVVVYSASELLKYLSQPGTAGRLLYAAREALKPVAPHVGTINNAARKGVLQEAHRAPTREAAASLTALGLHQVVLGVDDRVAVAESLLLTEHLEGGAPAPATWHGLRVLASTELANPPLYCNPRTGKVLQAGEDELTGVRWGDLGLDGLRLAAFAYREGMLDGYSEVDAHNALQQPATTARIQTRAKARNVDLATMDRHILHRREAPPRPTAPEQPVLRDGSPRDGARTQDLEGLLLACFGAEEMRTFARYGVEGDRVHSALPGATASPAQTAHAIADTWRRWGLIDRPLMERWIAERPRRADQIRAVFARLNVL